ncbi:T9SS type B sorting domain-containing protein [bacterium]|nr:T9SS type B sorting domain-containing protein [bacterium]
MKGFLTILLSIVITGGNMWVKAQCSFDFSYSQKEICQNDVVRFAIKGIPANVAQIDWDLGFKQVKNDSTPIVIFPKSGTFSVSLTITLKDGSHCTITKSGIIKVNPIPDMGQILATKTVLCDKGQTVQFTNTSKDAIRWVWTIEGSYYDNKNPVVNHTFNNYGKPYIQLTLENLEGCKNSLVYDSLIKVLQKPEVRMSAKPMVVCQLPGKLQLSPVYANHGTVIKSYSWYFQGASPGLSNMKIPEMQSYYKPGNYNVNLELKTAGGCAYSFEEKAAVTVMDFSGVEVKALPLTGKGCNTLKYKVLVSGVKARYINWEYNPKDVASIDSSKNDSTVFEFKSDGNYTITCVVGLGVCKKKFPLHLKAKAGTLNAAFTLPDCTCHMPDSVDVKITSKGNGTLKHHWDIFLDDEWVYGDNLQQPDFAFYKDGRYFVRLRETDKDGCYDFAKHSIWVKSDMIDTGRLAGFYCKGDVKFNLKKDSLCNVHPEDIKWYFYDENNSLLSTDTGWFGVHTYEKIGNYSAAVTIKTKSGCVDSVFIDHGIRVRDCLKGSGIRFPITNIGCTGLVRFTDSHKFDPKDIVEGVLIWQSDTTVRIKGSYKYPNLDFNVGKPGIYNIMIYYGRKDAGQSKIIYIKNFVKVNQLTVDAKVGKPSGCFPEKKIPLELLKITRTDYAGTGPSEVSFVWSIFTANTGSAVLDNPKDSFPTITMLSPGQVDIQIKVRDKLGCTAVWQATNAVKDDLNPKFKINGNPCYGDSILIENNSTGKILKYKWTSDKPGDSFFPNDFVKNPQLMPMGAGKRTVTLTLIDSNKCTAETTVSTDLVDLQLDFSVDDTTARCSPASFKFVAEGTNVDRYIWDFGDGDELKTTKKSVYKVYDLRRVDPYRNRFTVTVTGIASTGCERKVVKPYLIRILGPWPKFELSNKKGCSPHTVKFKDVSKNVSTMYFEYGDNSSADTQIAATHVYNADTTKEFEYFRPFVVATDNHGCRVAYVIDDTITVYSQPIARFKALPNNGCEPLQVKFKNKSKYAAKSWWSIPGGTYKSTRRNADTTFLAGVYGAKLMVQNAIGCSDELLKPRIIRVFAKPSALFEFSDSVTCIGKKLDANNMSTGDTTLTHYLWRANFNSIADSSTEKDYTFSTQTAGKWQVSLFVQDAVGCRDTFTLGNTINVYDSLPITIPSFNFVSHTANDQIKIQWKRSNPAYFRQMELYYYTDSIEKIIASKGLTELEYLYQNDQLDRQSNCFKLYLIDKCRDVYPSELHCSVHLQVDEKDTMLTHLNWNHYVGWDSIESYKVYRKAKGGFTQLATLPGNVNYYTDSSFCDSTYQYKVVAQQFLIPYESHSNTLKHRTAYTYQNMPLEVLVTTVENNEEIVTYWHPSQQFGQLQYEISRRPQLLGKNNSWKTTADTFIIDSKAEVQDFYYTYKVQVHDKCGNVGGKSNMGRSILLNVDQVDDKVVLHWNRYYMWLNGVDHYQVEIKKPDARKFEILGNTTDSFFSDINAFTDYEKAYTYRVKAVEKGMAPDTSYSNERVVIPLPSIFAPNAFSPNGDGINDSFAITGWALIDDPENIKAFNMMIFNRWGEKIFESQNINNGWNGTFKGVACELGQYIWLAKVTALNGKIYFLKGGVLLLK